jgi:hypothetical protein
LRFIIAPGNGGCGANIKSSNWYAWLDVELPHTLPSYTTLIRYPHTLPAYIILIPSYTVGTLGWMLS